MNKVNDYGNNVDPQEAEGSLRMHKSTILGKVGQIRAHCGLVSMMIRYYYGVIIC